MQLSKTSTSISTKTIHVMFALGLIILSSKISIPIGPVPLTMQTCAVGLTGALLGANLGFLTVCLYLLGGYFGLPIFATTLVGPVAFLGPTAGYLLAFPLAAWFVGKCADKGWNNSVLLSLVAQIFANICIINTLGALWLACILGINNAFLLGFVPFLIGSVLKSILASAVIRLIRLRA